MHAGTYVKTPFLRHCRTPLRGACRKIFTLFRGVERWPRVLLAGGRLRGVQRVVTGGGWWVYGVEVRDSCAGSERADLAALGRPGSRKYLIWFIS